MHNADNPLMMTIFFLSVFVFFFIILDSFRRVYKIGSKNGPDKQPEYEPSVPQPTKEPTPSPQPSAPAGGDNTDDSHPGQVYDLACLAQEQCLRLASGIPSGSSRRSLAFVFINIKRPSYALFGDIASVALQGQL